MMKKILFVLMAALLSLQAQAMSFYPQGKHLFISGGVVGDELGQFKDALDANPGITTVVLVNSSGGNLWAGMALGREIVSRELDTVAVGKCVSSCSIMFMGGKNRQFSDAYKGFETYIGIHGPADRDTGQVNPAQAPQMRVFYQRRMGDQYKEAMIEASLYDMKDHGALLYAYEPVRNTKNLLYHCNASTLRQADCKHFAGEDALSIGVITSKTLYSVELPEALKVQAIVWGRKLTNADVNAMHQAFASRHAADCKLDACKNHAENFMKGEPNKAFAGAISTLGYGTAIKANSPELAVHGAIYRCNFSFATSRLCQASYVDGSPMGGFYEEAKNQSIQAMLDLNKVTTVDTARELQAYHEATALKTSGFTDPTPLKVAGAKTLSTQLLLDLMKSRTPPVLIDVAQDPQTLPHAHSFVKAGNVNANEKLDLAIQTRLASMLAIVAPDQQQALVFYCASQNCWLSVNASLRAVKAGYTNVYWYRGGIEAWRAAGLPLVQKAVTAVID
jgi:PQQ-dependent catabolism-associated CXXCW motif protein